jgi:cell division protein FtsW (lipid II flippase)
MKTPAGLKRLSRLRAFKYNIYKAGYPMFELYILISRYIFLILAAIFLIQGVIFTLAQKKIINPHVAKEASLLQRVVILLTHITAFSILCFGSGASYASIFIAVASFVFFIAAFALTGLFYKNACRLIINCVFYLMCLSLIMITRLNPFLAQRQLIWFVTGYALFLLIPVALKIIPKTDRLSVLYLILGGLLLLSPFIFGVMKGGALNWISISVSSYEIAFQPSEMVKFLFVFYLACVFRKDRKFKELLVPIGASMAFVLILVSQRDLGGALIFFITFMVMLYISTNNLWLVSFGFLTFGGACVGAYHLFAHVQKRVVAWLDPWSDIPDAGWQITQALFAAGTWGPFGSGLTRGLPESIPAVESDFIFAAFCEEFGALFGLCIIGVYILIFYRGMSISIRAKEKYHGKRRKVHKKCKPPA